MDNDVMITTVDNPFNPFTQFDDWNKFDTDKGYFTCSYLARIAMVADNLSFGEIEQELERAIDEMLSYDKNGLYKKVYSNEQ